MTGQGRGGGDPVVDLEVVEGLDLEQLVVEACEAPFAAAMAADSERPDIRDGLADSRRGLGG